MHLKIHHIWTYLNNMPLCQTFSSVIHIYLPSILSLLLCGTATQALYKSDWRNYMERTGIAGEQQAMSKTHLEDTRLWASFRAQTLARTVEGIMYYESALRLLANCEGIKDPKVCVRYIFSKNSKSV